MRLWLGQSSEVGVRPLGLARRVQTVSARLLILPGDPFATDLSFDDEFWKWWVTARPPPFGSQFGWTNTEPTVDAAVKYMQGSEKWATYLAVHRNGGVEVGCDPTWSSGEEYRFFGLGRTVGLVWMASATQAEVVGRFGLTGPWELTLTLYKTEGTYLAGFGRGWAEPGRAGWYDVRAQQDPHIMIRREVGSFPGSEIDIRDLAFDIGDRIENAWGVRDRRFLDREGDMEGKFEARRWSF